MRENPLVTWSASWESSSNIGVKQWGKPWNSASTGPQHFFWWSYVSMAVILEVESPQGDNTDKLLQV